MEQNLNISYSEDLVAVIVKLWHNKTFIIVSCCIGAALGLIIGFSKPRTYEAKIIFAPETEQTMGSGISSIASMMGVNIDNSVDAISIDMLSDVLSSTPFVFDLFQTKVEMVDGTQTYLLDYLKHYQKKPWWSYVFGAPFMLIDKLRSDDENAPADSVLVMTNLPSEEREFVKMFSEILRVEFDKKTGAARLTIRMQDPLVAATVLEEIVRNYKKYMSDYRTSKARQDVENLTLICEERRQDYYKSQQIYADFVDANKNLILLRAQAEQLKLQQEMQLAYQVYSQVATQLEAARLKEQQAKPVFVVIEPISVPLKPVGPGKFTLLVVFTFLSACVSIGWILFGRRIWFMFRNQL